MPGEARTQPEPLGHDERRRAAFVELGRRMGHRPKPSAAYGMIEDLPQLAGPGEAHSEYSVLPSLNIDTALASSVARLASSIDKIKSCFTVRPRQP